MESLGDSSKSENVPLPESRPGTPPIASTPSRQDPPGTDMGSSSFKARRAMFEQPSEPPSGAAKSPKRQPETKAAAVLLQPEPVAGPSKPSPVSSRPASTNQPITRIWGIVLVDFDHALGPKVEYSYPSDLQQHEDLSANLPFLALPDGSHARDEDYSYFHMLCPSVSDSTIFGISCNRQLPSEQLKRRSKVVTRSTVQKAIVVLASQPVFGPIRDKLGVVTRALFAQKDFAETQILVDFYSSMEAGFAEVLEENALYMGTSIRELIHTFRFKTLMLLKLLLLQRRVMFYGQHVERLCNFQYSLVSLVPLLLDNLNDAASPELDQLSRRAEKCAELRTSDKQSLLKYLGLPLQLFGKGAFFQPYLPLQQIDLIQEAMSFVVGTTNSIFQQQRDCQFDVLVNVDTASIDFLNPQLAVLVNLTAPDRKWMDEIVSTVSETWNATDPARPLGMKFVGSDDYLRAKFEEYLCSALAAVKFVDFMAKGTSNNALLGTSDLATGLASYNEAWLNDFRQTPAFAFWNQQTDEVIFDLIEPRHPCEGSTNLVQDVGIRLAQGVHSLHLDQNLGGAKDAIGKGIQTGTQSVFGFVSGLRSDFSRRQAEYMAKREQEVKLREEQEAKLREEQATSVEVGMAEEAKQDTPAPAPPTPGPLLSAAVLTGVSEASTRAASIATSVGSFFSAKRSQFFQPQPRPPTAVPLTQELQPREANTSAPTSVLDTAYDTFPPLQANPVRKPATFAATNEPAAPSSGLPSFFRRISSSGGPQDKPKEGSKTGLKELSLSSTPVFGDKSSPKLSPRTLIARPLSGSSRPSSMSSAASNRSSRSTEYEHVPLPP